MLDYIALYYCSIMFFNIIVYIQLHNEVNVGELHHAGRTRFWCVQSQEA
jgi:hypothetical protein